MKRYALFAGVNYYPSGGWDDFVSTFNTVDEAIAVGVQTFAVSPRDARPCRVYDWYHVVDLTTGEQVAVG